MEIIEKKGDVKYYVFALVVVFLFGLATTVDPEEMKSDDELVKEHLCEEKIEMSDGTFEQLAVPGCEDYYREKLGE